MRANCFLLLDGGASSHRAEIFIVISISRPGVHTRALIDFKMITMMTGAVITDDDGFFLIIASFSLRCRFRDALCFVISAMVFVPREREQCS